MSGSAAEAKRGCDGVFDTLMAVFEVCCCFCAVNFCAVYFPPVLSDSRVSVTMWTQFVDETNDV